MIRSGREEVCEPFNDQSRDSQPVEALLAALVLRSLVVDAAGLLEGLVAVMLPALLLLLPALAQLVVLVVAHAVLLAFARGPVRS
ncbi:hypothetical protein CQ044_08315 [Microbacterium sp. MYb64]|nr:hypothetical protein CQ044_08315 [Microbacterium sp. MYb64]